MHVFAYGSLMFPEVWRRVTGDTRRGEPALLADHARHAIHGESYPGVVARCGAQVPGVLYRDVGEAALAALDAFEGPEYERVTVRVRDAAGAQVDAAAYLYLVPGKLSASPWEPQAFDLAGFIARPPEVRAAAMHVFAYGSLMFPEVWRRVTGDTRRGEPALLADHARHAIHGESYPGVVARCGAQVPGVLYRDVGEAALAALDAFEGPEYERVTVRVRDAAGAQVDAAAYLYLVPGKLSASPWEPQAFDLAGFIARHCR
ncbi:gamma-glutamylcyclotransferase family protein [Noviherbaspirillum aridicola]|uniref:Putative gamma-glutamylcyclotransferase n=1 Tax=Noviherbaspirillum aridicola TaxID=2849687 RepID=A0ABQ4Q3M2_9BURK|nr:gamma-glutamylcyclotransferase family protein [Noviherbaspirillum aridicola]GIZ51783.1 hypothetical protein NCCP691_17970 [Noviherbaspirillum aridicola]